MKFKAPLLFALTLSSVAFAAQAPGQAVNLDGGSGSVEFKAVGHPSAVKIVGKGTAPKGKFDVAGQNVSGAATFDLTSLNTGIDLRDKHMKDKYLEVGKYPLAKLTITKLAVPSSLKDGASFSDVPFSGKLNLHGVEHDVSGKADVKESGSKLDLRARFGLKIADYGISQPGFAGITMADEVEIDVQSTGNIANL